MSLALHVFWRDACVLLVVAIYSSSRRHVNTARSACRYDCGCPLFAELGKNLYFWHHLPLEYSAFLVWAEEQEEIDRDIHLHARCSKCSVICRQFVHILQSGAHIDIQVFININWQGCIFYIFHCDAMIVYSTSFLYLCQHIASFLKFFLSRSSWTVFPDAF